MTEFINLTGLDGVDKVLLPLILALPLFVIATLVAILARLRRSAKIRRARLQTALAQETATQLLDQAPVENAAANTASRQTTVREPPERARPLATPSAPGSKREEPQRQETKSPAVSIAALQSQINEAMKAQPNNTLAPLFLEMARHHKVAGDESSYLAALRSAAGLAAQHGPLHAHAEARLQLAEAAYVAGDLTGACEQWQMARDALYNDGQKEAHAQVEKRMRDNGCPTDWVLTDF